MDAHHFVSAPVAEELRILSGIYTSTTYPVAIFLDYSLIIPVITMFNALCMFMVRDKPLSDRDVLTRGS